MMHLILWTITLMYFLLEDIIIALPVNTVNIPWIFDRIIYHSLENDSLLRNNNGDIFYEICHSESCKKDAKNLEYYLDLSVDPCEDFYQFSCGGWLNKQVLPNSEASWDTFNLLQQKINRQVLNILEEPSDENEQNFIQMAKNFYMACKNEEKLNAIGMEPLKKLLDNLGGWPISKQYWFEEEFNLQKLMIELFKSYNVEALVTMAIEADLKNQSRNLIYMDQVQTLFPETILNNPKVYKKQIKAYGEWIIKIVNELIDPEDEISIHTIKNDAIDIVNFEMELIKISTPSENRRDMTSLYNSMTIEQLQKLISKNFKIENKIDWLEFFSYLFHDSSVNIDSDTEIIIFQLDYIENLNKLLAETSPRVIANYMMWRLVAKYTKETTSQMRYYSNDIDRIIFGVKEGLSRELECQSLTTSYFGKAIGYQYLNKYFDEETREKVFEITTMIHNVFIKQLERSAWMDEETKTKAIEKAKAMQILVGYTSEYKNLTLIIKEYENISVSDKHFKNYVFLNQHEVYKNLKELSEDDPKENWDMEPTEINAGYSTTNAIFVLAGILQYPFFDKKRLQVLNFGALGSIIGHEITHGFDDIGRQFDKDGNLLQWWSDDTITTYLDKVQCFINQFDNFRVPEIDLITHNQTKLNGMRTQGENIADSGGLNQAYRAYRAYVKLNGREQRLPGELEKYNPEQLFFISFATNWCEILTKEELAVQVSKDEHSPNKYRVLGSIENSKYFSEAFKCPEKSTMNPDQKCVLW